VKAGAVYAGASVSYNYAVHKFNIPQPSPFSAFTKISAPHLPFDIDLDGASLLMPNPRVEQHINPAILAVPEYCKGSNVPTCPAHPAKIERIHAFHYLF
jgi:hypothetical protein